MARRFIKPKHDRLFREGITGLINDLANKSVFEAVVIDGRSECPNCGYDQASDASNNAYNGIGPDPFAGNVCPVCNGHFWIENKVTRRIKAAVQWGRPEMHRTRTDVTMAGTLPEGFVRVKCEVRHFDDLRNADHFIVDGIRCSRLSEPIRRGLQSMVAAEVVLRRDD